MMWVVAIVFLVLGALAFRRTRWAYFTFVALGVLFFPARVGFHFNPQPCECSMSVPLALFSLTNYGHVWRFTIFFLMTSAQMPNRRTRDQLFVALAAVMAMGIYVELAEGFTGDGHCRLRDLVPDLAGALLGAVLLLLWKLVRSYRSNRGRAA